MKVSGYTPGSIYKRFNGTNMSRMNRETVSSNASAANSYGTSVFDTNMTLSQGISQIATQQYAARITAEAKAKLESTSGITNLLASLGATSSS
jgi:hypothetical protein